LVFRPESNVIEAISNGACSVVEMVIMIGANLIVFIATVAFLNQVVAWFGELAGIQGLTFEVRGNYARANIASSSVSLYTLHFRSVKLL
jgi:concentrative nucleoside transporter, CNT family